MRALLLLVLLVVSNHLSAQLYGTGMVFNDDNYAAAEAKLTHSTDEYKNLPSSASLKQFSPKPGNQLQLNTSPSWAVAWSAQSILYAKKHRYTDQQLITHNTFSPAYTYYSVRMPKDENCENGIDLYRTLDFIKSSGSKAYDDFLEFCPRGIPEDVIRLSADKRISDFTKLFDDGDPDRKKINAVKKSVAEQFPVVIGMYCPPSFFNANKFWQPTESMSQDLPGHAMCVVGYDDQKYGGAFEVINSWGSRWGNEGFIWIRYGDFVNFTKYAYELFSIDSDNKGFHQFIGSLSIRLYPDEEMSVIKSKAGFFKAEKPIYTGSHFQLHFTGLNPSFVYLFSVDDKNNYSKLFPENDKISPALIYKTNEKIIPAADQYIKTVEEPGHEKLCVLYSKEAIDFDELIENLAKYPGDLSENIDALLGGKLIDSDKVFWDDAGIGFTAESNTKTALFFEILVDHIE